MTGPKTSFWMISSSCFRPETTVGGVEVALVADPAGRLPRPWRASGSRSMKPATCLSWLALLSGPYSTSSSSGRPVLVSAAAFGERGDELVVDRLRATSTRVAAVQSWPALKKPADGDALDGPGDVGVVEDDDGRLAAQLQVDALERPWPRTRRPAMPARTEPVMEAIAGMGCSTIRPAGVAVAADDVEDALAAGLGR